MAWSSTKPISSEQIVDICGLFQAQWNAIELWQGVQHYAFSQTNSGRHRPGNTSVFCADVTSSLSQLSAANNLADTGSLGLDTSACCYKYYSQVSSAWRPVDYYNTVVSADLPQTWVTASAATGWYTPANNADKTNHSSDWPSTAGLFEFYPGYYENTDHMSGYSSGTQASAVDSDIHFSEATVDGFGKYYFYFTPPDDGLYLLTPQLSLSATNVDEFYGIYLYYYLDSTHARRETSSLYRPYQNMNYNISQSTAPIIIYLTKDYPVYVSVVHTDVATGAIKVSMLSASNWLDIARIA